MNVAHAFLAFRQGRGASAGAPLPGPPPQTAWGRENGRRVPRAAGKACLTQALADALRFRPYPPLQAIPYSLFPIPYSLFPAVQNRSNVHGLGTANARSRMCTTPGLSISARPPAVACQGSTAPMKMRDSVSIGTRTVASTCVPPA
jgi:hypothetical protein